MFTNSEFVFKENTLKLFFFTFLLAVLTYWLRLTTFSITIDNETPIYSDFGLLFGRWGQNLILFKLFNGHQNYFSLLFSLFIYAVASVKLVNLFKFKDFSSFIFCSLFVTFPQFSYQIVFGMMTVISSLGVFIAVVGFELFVKYYNQNSKIKYLIYFIISLSIAFLLAIYQAFLIFPITILVIYFLLRTFQEDFNIKNEIIKILIFTFITLFAIIFYYLSVKILCPPIQNSEYLSSFTGGSYNNIFDVFYENLKINLKGNAYYGEKIFCIASLSALILILRFGWLRILFVYRFLAICFIIIAPFVISFLISNGYYPPRIYLTSNMVFAFLIVFLIEQFNFSKKLFTICIVTIIVFINISNISDLFNSTNKIYDVDKKIAENIDETIQRKYPTFNTSNKYVYFHGCFPFDFHQKYRLEGSEIFGGSFFSWDNGSNYRIINFFSGASISEYKMVETKEMYNTFKDSIKEMPVWPNTESVKMFKDNVVVVKLGENKGAPLFFE